MLDFQVLCLCSATRVVRLFFLVAEATSHVQAVISVAEATSHVQAVISITDSRLDGTSHSTHLKSLTTFACTRNLKGLDKPGKM